MSRGSSNAIVDREMTGGRHELTWTATAGPGRDVASGTYFYRLTADLYRETKRMVLIK